MLLKVPQVFYLYKLVVFILLLFIIIISRLWKSNSIRIILISIKFPSINREK